MPDPDLLTPGLRSNPVPLTALEMFVWTSLVSPRASLQHREMFPTGSRGLFNVSAGHSKSCGYRTIPVPPIATGKSDTGFGQVFPISPEVPGSRAVYAEEHEIAGVTLL